MCMTRTLLGASLATLVLAAPAALAQISLKPADAVIPVVGSTRGASNANFRTELQMTNTSDSVVSGWLYLRPQALVRRYELPPRATLSFDDVVAEMGGSGLGSLDILADRERLPAIVVRAYDDQPSGTTGVTVPAVPAADVLIGDTTGTLIVPRGLGARYRFNIGVRALDNGATLHLIVRSAAGTERHRRAITLESHHFEQRPGDAFAGIPLQPNDSIEVQFATGSAIVYATTVDNATNDSSIQLLRK